MHAWPLRFAHATLLSLGMHQTVHNPVYQVNSLGPFALLGRPFSYLLYHAYEDRPRSICAGALHSMGLACLISL